MLDLECWPGRSEGLNQGSLIGKVSRATRVIPTREIEGTQEARSSRVSNNSRGANKPDLRAMRSYERIRVMTIAIERR